MPTAAKLSVDLVANIARFEQSMGEARGVLGRFAADARKMNDVLWGVARAGAAIGAVRAGVAITRGVIAGMSGDWKQLDDAMSSLPFRFGQAYVGLRSLGDLILGVTTGIKEMQKEFQAGFDWTTAVASLAGMEREFQLKAGLAGADKLTQDLAKIEEQARKAHEQIAKVAREARLPLSHPQVQAAGAAVDFYALQMANERKAAEPNAFRDELVRLGEAYSRVTRDAAELAEVRYRSLGFGEQEILILLNLAEVTEAAVAAQERSRREWTYIESAATAAADAWRRGIQEGVDATYEMVRAGEALEKSLRTPAEILADQIAEVTALLKEGALEGGAKTFDRAVRDAVARAAGGLGGEQVNLGSARTISRRMTYGGFPGGETSRTIPALLQQQLAEMARSNEYLYRLLHEGGLQ